MRLVRQGLITVALVLTGLLNPPLISAEDEGPVTPTHIGCPAAANLSLSVLQNQRFQAELFRFSRRTYPLCKVPAGGLPAARRQLESVPSGKQGVSCRRSPIVQRGSHE
jgi:hypothetical protein